MPRTLRRPVPKAIQAAAVRGITGAAALSPATVSRLKRDALSADRRERRQVGAFVKELDRAGVPPHRLSRTSIFTGSESLARRDRPGRVAQSASSVLASLGDLVEIPVNLPTITARPPYDYQWTWTKRIAIAPGTLEAHAYKSSGRAGFDMASKHSSNQLNKSRARAAVGIFYQPADAGVITIYPRVDADWSSYIKWNKRVAHAWGWSGLLVQTYEVGSNDLLGTPIDRKRMLFDRSGGGGTTLPFDVEVDLDFPDPPPPTVVVSPDRWYAIWVWCGGGIRAAGWQTILGMNVGSDAKSKVDLDVSSIALYFAPVAIR